MLALIFAYVPFLTSRALYVYNSALCREKLIPCKYCESQVRPLCVWIKWIEVIVSGDASVFTVEFTVTKHVI